MPTHKTNNESELPVTRRAAPPSSEKERDRIRDIIVVFVTYPITPTKETKKVAESKPWLEFLSLLLKVALAAYALYEGMNG